jgi:hypothetical protein
MQCGGHASAAVIRKGAKLMVEDRKERAEPIDDSARPRGGGPDSAKSLGATPARGAEGQTPRGGGPDSAKSLDNDRADANQDSDPEEELTPKKL